MRVGLIASGLLLLALFSGCADQEPDPATGVETNLITPGVWKITGSPDRILMWAHNLGTGDVEISWKMTLAGGAPLPDGWNLTFSRPTATLKPFGTKTQGARGTEYPDWGWTLATLTLPAGQAAGRIDVQVHTGVSNRTAALDIAANRTTVTAPNQEVSVKYAGRFQDNNEEFDSGDFDTTLGSGKTVTGFDYGLMGLALREKAEIVIPPALAYGYDNTHPNYVKFNGRTLVFALEITRIR